MEKEVLELLNIFLSIFGISEDKLYTNGFAINNVNTPLGKLKIVMGSTIAFDPKETDNKIHMNIKYELSEIGENKNFISLTGIFEIIVTKNHTRHIKQQIQLFDEFGVYKNVIINNFNHLLILDDYEKNCLITLTAPKGDRVALQIGKLIEKKETKVTSAFIESDEGLEAILEKAFKETPLFYEFIKELKSDLSEDGFDLLALLKITHEKIMENESTCLKLRI